MFSFFFVFKKFGKTADVNCYLYFVPYTMVGLRKVILVGGKTKPLYMYVHLSFIWDITIGVLSTFIALTLIGSAGHLCHF